MQLGHERDPNDLRDRGDDRKTASGFRFLYSEAKAEKWDDSFYGVIFLYVSLAIKAVVHVCVNVVTNIWFFTTRRFHREIKPMPGPPGPEGPCGRPGKSTYQIWLDLGYTGTAEDFLTWLRSEVALDPTKYTRKPNDSPPG